MDKLEDKKLYEIFRRYENSMHEAFLLDFDFGGLCWLVGYDETTNGIRYQKRNKVRLNINSGKEHS